MKITLAQIQAVPKLGDLGANHKALLSLLGTLTPKTVDVVITPECFLDGYVVTNKDITQESLRDYGVDPDTSSYVKDIGNWAGRTNAWFFLGCTRISQSRTYNSTLIFNRKGDLTGAYDKVHCQTHDQKFTPGDSLPVFESDFGKFGVMICADRRWPETVRTLALGGARVIFNPTYGMWDERNLRMMQTRSYESEVFIAFTHTNQSLITGPSGEIVVNNISQGDSVTVTEIDLSRVDKERSGPASHLKDCRPEVYKK